MGSAGADAVIRCNRSRSRPSMGKDQPKVAAVDPAAARRAAGEMRGSVLGLAADATADGLAARDQFRPFSVAIASGA